MSAADGPTINANLMDLLPRAERDPVVENAVARVNTHFERRMVMLVGANDFETAKAAAKYVSRRLTGSGQFHDLRLDHDPDLVKHAISFYLPLRFQLLGDLARNQLRAGDEAAFEHTVLMRYYNPKSTINSGLIEKDPLLLLPRYLEQHAMEASGRPEIEDGYLTVKSDGKIYIILTGELSGSPFSLSLQQKLMPLLGEIRTDLPRRFQGAVFLMAGALPYAAAGTKSAVDETSTVGLGSLLGIIVILFVIFRSPRPFFLTLVSIFLGCLGGFAACLAVFGQVHLLTLVFGSSLVGISVDYSLHYFCERFRFAEDWTPQSALRHIFPGITLGLVTSVIGFAGLFFAPFPGMQGMAVFSSVGLCIAYGSVVFCYPYFTRRLPRPGFDRPLEWMRAYGALWRRKRDWRAWAAVAALAVLSVFGCLRLVANDDIRLLQTPDATVMAEQKRVQALIGQNLASQYFLVEGRDEADFLGREERLTEKLRALRKSGQLAGYLAISDFIASPRRQKENRALLAPLIVGKKNTLDRIARRIGLPDHTRDAYVAAFLESKRAPPTGLLQWLANPVSEPYRQLWLGPSSRGVVGVVGLRGANDLDALRALANSGPLVHFVDPAGEISGLFSQYRRQTTWRTIISYGVVMLLLLVRYGVGGGLLVMAVPVIAAIVSLSVLGLLGEAINLFNIMALLLVLGIGVDYALFFRETGTENPATLLAIALSSATTLLAFGLLALSATTAIHSFGLTILVGILVASLLSPMAGWKARAAPAENSERRQ
ncbi:MAG: MMPL family transporter [Proteobacteria bacterium]|nr:MMPL family transporter [Pseudomonadota bacterium]